MRISIFLSILLFFLPLKTFAENDKFVIEAQAEISKSGYIGEALEYVVTLKSSIPNIADIRIAFPATFPETVTVLNGSIQNQRAREITEKGKTYYCWTIQRNFIIPRKEGKIVVSPSKFIAFIPKEKIVKDFFWGTRRIVDYDEIVVECKGVTTKIMKLPDNNTGEDFTGGVGDFNIEGWFPPGKITVGSDALAVFTISGFGNLEELKLPNIYKLFSQGCKLKNISQEESRSQRGGKLFSEITLTCTFVPEKNDFIINPLSLLFFDPSKGKYVLKSSEALHWSNESDNSVKPHYVPKDAIEI